MPIDYNEDHHALAREWGTELHVRREWLAEHKGYPRPRGDVNLRLFKAQLGRLHELGFHLMTGLPWSPHQEPGEIDFPDTPVGPLELKGAMCIGYGLGLRFNENQGRAFALMTGDTSNGLPRRGFFCGWIRQTSDGQKPQHLRPDTRFEYIVRQSDLLTPQSFMQLLRGR